MEIRLLGPLEVHLGGRLIEVPRGRVRTLLTALAVSRGRRVSPDTLVEYLWDEAPPTARQGLQNAVWRLRRVIGADAVAADGAAYRLAVDPDAVDLTRFARLLDQAVSAGDRERELLVAALELWRGAPLDGIESETLQSEIVPILTERYLAARERRIDLDLAAGVSDGLVVELRSLVAEHPIRESLWTRLLRALAASGRDAEALQAYEDVRHELAERLGSDPSEELRELHQRLLAGVRLTGPRRETATRAATARAPRELPTDVSGFVGRVDELAALDRLLDNHTGDGRRPVMTVVLHGVGGAGKTALAVRWAHSVADQFPDGQFYLDLHGYGPAEHTTAHDALGSLLRSAGVDGAAVPQQLHERAGLWRTTVTGRRVLLLDNVRDADQVRPLLPGADSAVLVTSRSQLRGLSRRDGAASLPLPELSQAEGRQLFTATLGTARMRQNAASINELIDLGGGLPLALRIAADLANRHTGALLAELVQGLRTHRLETLADPDDPAADPRTVLSWSYQRLDPDMARAFRLLGLHPGTNFGVDSAAALLDAPLPDVRRLLDRFVSVHLLEQPGFGRYRFHDLVREYAAELAAEAPEAEIGSAVERCLTWYLHTSLRATRLLRPEELFSPAGDPSALPPLPGLTTENDAAAWYDAEWPTVLDAVRVAATHGCHDHAWQLPRTLLTFSELRHHVADLLRVAEVGVASAERTRDPQALFFATHLLGAALARVGRHDEAESYLRVALHHAEGIGDPVAVCRALGSLGLNASLGGDHHTAVGYEERALELAREIGDVGRMANCLLNIGGTYSYLGEYDVAIRHTREALTLWRSTGFEIGVAWSLANLAEMHQLAGRNSTALEYGEQALGYLRPIGAAETMPSLLLAMGRAHAAAGDPDAARKMWQEGIDVRPKTPTRADAELRQALADLDAGAPDRRRDGGC
ncbi:MAG: BTAD domain-containing putative transcriptional regulator [Micromonosporaceae bacterium]